MQSTITSEYPEVSLMTNLSVCSELVKGAGYKEDFQVINKQLMPFDKRRAYSPHQVRIVNFYRFEGQSDPGDNTVLYVIETDDGMKGTLVDGYGAYARSEVAEFIVEVESIQKAQLSKSDA